MLDEKQILSLNFLSYGGIFTGDHCGMRYRMARTGEKPDFTLTAWVWPEPLSFEATPEERKICAQFPFTEEGHGQAVHWIQEQYETGKEEWDRAPTLLNSMV